MFISTHKVIKFIRRKQEGEHGTDVRPQGRKGGCMSGKDEGDRKGHSNNMKGGKDGGKK